MTGPPCWLNGALLPAAAARIDPADRGFTLGDGVFETIAVYAGRPAHLARHLLRLRLGAAVLAIGCRWPDGAIGAAIDQVVTAAGWPDAAVRLTLTRGAAPRGVLPQQQDDPTLLVTIGALPPPAPPARLILCTVTRRNEASPLAGIKSLNYLDSILARQQAARHGADDALLLNTAGRVAEATAATLIVAHAAGLATPPLADGALPGIARGLLIERAGVTERSLLPADLLDARALLLASSLGLRTVASLDGRAYPATDLPGRLQPLLRDDLHAT